MKKIIVVLIVFFFCQQTMAQFTGGSEITSSSAKKSNGLNGILKFGMSTIGDNLKSLQFKDGYMLEFGGMPYFNPASKAMVRTGMIISDDFIFYPGGDNINSSTGKKGKDLLINMGIKIGPAITVNPADKLLIQAYYGFHPTLALGTISGVDQSKIYISMMNAVGINLAYSGFILGAEYDSGKFKYQTLAGSNKIDCPTMRFTIGFFFN